MTLEVGVPASSSISSEYRNGTLFPIRPSASIVRDTYLRRIPAMLIALGDAKLNYPREHPRITELSDQITQEGDQLVKQALETEDGPVVRAYYDIAEDYVAQRSGVGRLRDYVEQNYEVSFDGLDRFAEDVRGRKVVTFFNHYRQGPEISDLPSGFGAGLRGHDLAPVFARLFTDQALMGTDLVIARSGKPLHPNDEFYFRSAEEIGNIPLKEDVQKVSDQFQDVWARGEIPSICPEAGLRCLKQWRTGGLVAAVLAEADGIALIAQSPWISIIDRRVQFGYAGFVPISDAVKEAVSGRETVARFNSQLRRKLAEHLVVLEYDPWYTNSIHQAVPGLRDEPLAREDI